MQIQIDRKQLPTDEPSIALAAIWLATTPEAQRPHPILPHLQKSFGLTAKAACDAIREANLLKARAH